MTLGLPQRLRGRNAELGFELGDAAQQRQPGDEIAGMFANWQALILRGGPMPAANRKPGCIVVLGGGFLIVIVATGLALVGSLLMGDDVPANESTAARGAEPSTTPVDPSEEVRTSSECRAAIRSIKASCPRGLAWIDPPKCSASSRPQIAAIDHTQELKPGKYISFANPGPEWFLRDDGTLVTANGVAASACDGLMDVPTFLGRQQITTASKRGENASDYEGVFGNDGNWLHNDCSTFEVRVARIYHKELWAHPELSDDEAARRGANKAARAFGVTRKMANDIHMKASSQCPRALLVD